MRYKSFHSAFNSISYHNYNWLRAVLRLLRFVFQKLLCKCVCVCVYVSVYSVLFPTFIYQINLNYLLNESDYDVIIFRSSSICNFRQSNTVCIYSNVHTLLTYKILCSTEQKKFSCFPFTSVVVIKWDIYWRLLGIYLVCLFIFCYYLMRVCVATGTHKEKKNDSYEIIMMNKKK